MTNNNYLYRKKKKMKNEYINSLKTIDSVEQYRKEINESCDERISRINILNKASDLSKKDFGYIKECFESLSPALFKTIEGRKIINKYTTTIKEDKTLATLHSIYEGIRKTDKNSDVDYLINNIINENIKLNTKQVNESTSKLGNILAEAYITLNENNEDILPKENVKLDNAIKFITENKKTLKNVSEFSLASKVIREEIEKHETINIFENRNIDVILTELLTDFNKKYSDKLTEEEKKMVKELSENTNKEEVFKKYKDICLNKITEAKNNFEKEGNVDSVNKLSSISEQINKKVYSEETIEKDICNFIEITSIF